MLMRAPLYEERLALLREHEIEEDGEPASTLIRYGEVLVNLDRPSEGRPMIEESLQLRRDVLEAEDWRISSAEAALGWCLVQLGAFEEGEGLLRAAHDGLRGRLSPPSRQREVREYIARMYEMWGKPDQAEEWR